MFHKSRKGLGSMTASGDDTWVPTACVSGDTLATLANAYGVSAQEICKENGVPFSTKAIQNWVKATGGRVLPYNPKSHPFSDKQEGWAVFTGASTIRLPNIPRRDGKGALQVTDGRGGPMAASAMGSAGTLAVLIALLIAGLIIIPKLRKRARGQAQRQSVLEGYFK